MERAVISASNCVYFVTVAKIALRKAILDILYVKRIQTAQIRSVNVHFVAVPLSADKDLLFLAVCDGHKGLVEVLRLYYLKGVLVEYGISVIMSVGRLTVSYHKVAVLKERDAVRVVERQYLALLYHVAVHVGFNDYRRLRGKSFIYKGNVKIFSVKRAALNRVKQ